MVPIIIKTGQHPKIASTTPIEHGILSERLVFNYNENNAPEQQRSWPRYLVPAVSIMLVEALIEHYGSPGTDVDR